MRFIFKFFLVFLLTVVFFLEAWTMIVSAQSGNTTLPAVTPGTVFPAYPPPPQPIKNVEPLLPLGPQQKYPGATLQKVVKGTGTKGVLATIQNIFATAKEFIGPILVFFLGAMAIRLIIARGSEEDFNKIADQFVYILAGVAFLIFADQLSDLFSIYRGSGQTAQTFLSNIPDTSQKFNDYLGIVVKVLRYLLGGIAVFYVVRSGVIIIFNADEETVKKQKEIFLYGFFGFILVIAAEAIVNAVFDVQTLPGIAQVNVIGGISLLMNFTNLLLAAISGLFLFTLVVGGAMYVFSAGSEEVSKKATTVIMGSLMGLIIAFSSYTLVAEFSSAGRPVEQREVNIQTESPGNLLPPLQFPSIPPPPPPQQPALTP